MKLPQFLIFLTLGATFGFVTSAQNTSGDFLSDQTLLTMAGNKYAAGELPLGDGHYVLGGPHKGYIYLCHKFGEEGHGGAQHIGNWIHTNTWNLLQKPAVQGNVRWSQAAFSVTVNNGIRTLKGNGLPLDHGTGIFPVQPNDPASAYDRNPNSIAPHNVMENLPAKPLYTDPPFCMGMEVGYMLNGVPLFNGFDAGLRDAAAHEVQDACQGHPQRGGVYHYHSLSSCIRDANEKTVLGYALDGFPITGPLVTSGKYLTTDDLDLCHGLTSEIIEDGQKKVTYHYVMTVDFPYSVSCFRAKPVRTGPPQQDGGGEGSNQGLPQNNAMGIRRPPAEAIGACQGRNNGDSCSFVSPRGDSITGFCRMPPTSSFACVPQ